MSAADEPASPRLRQLQRDVAERGSAVLDAFWREAAGRGTPLIEAADETDGRALVTFLWRGDDAAGQVLVRLPVDGSGQDQHSLSRLGHTDVWHVTFRLRRDYRAAYRFLIGSWTDPANFIELVDPLNDRTFIEPKDPERPDHTEDDVESVVALPAAVWPPWPALGTRLKQGTVAGRRFRSRRLGNERRLWVYTPPGYQPSGDPYRLLIVLDGRFFTFAIRTPAILDALLAQGRTPPLVAVLVDNPGDTWAEAMTIREAELACHDPFADFLAGELLPWLHGYLNLSSDPRQTVIAGGSFGGLAAAHAAWRHPEAFGRALALSGSFWWRPPGDEEWEWLTRQLAHSPRRWLRFYLAVGLLESAPASSGFPGQLLANRHLRDVLHARGYPVHYAEQMHGHDPVAWPGALAEGLTALLGQARR